MQQDDEDRIEIARSYSALWRAIYKRGDEDRPVQEQRDLLDLIRNGLDRKSAQLRTEGSTAFIANTYVVEATVASGGATELLRVRQRDLGSLHVLKTIAPSLQDDVVQAQHLRREAEIGLSIRHENLLETSALLRLDDGRPGLLMPWHPLFLDTLAVEVKLEPSAVRALVRGICSGLTALHDRGLVHCDLSPANILIDGPDCAAVKLGDFGITIPKGTRHSDLGISFAGSPEFCAPEQLAGGPADPRQDIYALGKILLRCVERINGESSIFWLIADQCCADDPERRPPRAADVLAILEN